MLIGLIGRLFYMALQFMASARGAVRRLQPHRGAPIEDAEPVPALATFITLTATVLLFATDQHWEVLRALLASYSVLPVNEPIAPELGLARLADAFSSTFVLALQISSPFIVYALIINFMVGIANKLVPQIPGLLHLHALRARRRAAAPLFHDRRGACACSWPASLAGWRRGEAS